LVGVALSEIVQADGRRDFSRSIRLATSVMAECWALRDGLNLATQLGIQNIIVELDAKTIVDLL